MTFWVIWCERCWWTWTTLLQRKISHRGKSYCLLNFGLYFGDIVKFEANNLCYWNHNDASKPLEYFYSMNNTQMRIARTNFRELLYVGGVLCQTDVQLLDSCWRAGTELIRSQKIRKKNDGRQIVYLLIPVSYHIILHLHGAFPKLGQKLGQTNVSCI